MQAVNISNDTWVTILSYLKDETTYPVNPDQFIAIMKMSFVNKSLRNIITANSFWILYNSNEYASAKYNIYDCNENFCQIMHKITSLKTHENIDKLSKSPYIQPINMGNAFYMVYYPNLFRSYKYNISNKEIVNSHAILNNKYEYVNDSKCSYLVENDYCILFTEKIVANHKEKITRFYIKKSNQFSCNDKCNTISDFYDNAINLYNDGNATLHDNYIWLTTCNECTGDINFYAINVMTNVTYLIAQIKDLFRSRKYSICYFAK